MAASAISIGWTLMPRTLRIAAAQYPLDPLRSLEEFETKLERWVAQGVNQGAELLVFPEYGAMELANITGTAGDLSQSLGAVSELTPAIGSIHARLAAEHKVTIVSASAPERQADGRLLNVARIFTPNGAYGRYDKLMPTP